MSRVRLFLSICCSLSLVLGIVSPVQGASGDRQLAFRNAPVALIEVTSTDDSGPGSLRQALLDAQPGTTIRFNLADFPPRVPIPIFVLTSLPALAVDNLTLDGSSSWVVLTGAKAQPATSGLTLAAHGCTVRGFTIRDFTANGITVLPSASACLIADNEIIFNQGDGIELRGSSDNILQNNNIGLEHTGMWSNGNIYNGVTIWQGASRNIIGGNSPQKGNRISGNHKSGIWISGAGSDDNLVIGNYIGTRILGDVSMGNLLNGVAIDQGSQRNLIGRSNPGEGNLISGNGVNGVSIADPGTSQNQVLNNLIGPDSTGTSRVWQGECGVLIANGAVNNRIGSTVPYGRNLISGNNWSGVCLRGAGTAFNSVQGNYIGSTLDGLTALPNNLHGIEISDGASDNRIGGSQPLGEGNLLSGNLNHGLLIHGNSRRNIVAGNLIGPNAAGLASLGHQDYGGMDIVDGAADNTIGGLAPGQGNWIGGNTIDGIFLGDVGGGPATGNQVLSNTIGLALDGHSPLPNQWRGLHIFNGAQNTIARGNRIAFHPEYGVEMTACGTNDLSENSIFSNGKGAIHSACLPAPTLTAVTTSTLTGQTLPGARVEFFADDVDQARRYVGQAKANSSGVFTYTAPGGFPIPNVTAFSSLPGSGVSPLSPPVHLLWTVMLYLDGDNDLSDSIFDTLDNLAANPPNHWANILALVDGYTRTVPGTSIFSGTALYNLSNGRAEAITASLSPTLTVPGELDMGSGATLQSFTHWAIQHYPSQYTALSIVDHGGGWAPSPQEVISNTLPAHARDSMIGNSGLSWDFTSNYDHLTIGAVRRALANASSRPLDVLFFDVCLMGLTEVAYEMRNSAAYFVSSQNIGWAPDGPQGRYVRTVSAIDATTTPRQLSNILVDAYASSLPPTGHPFTIAAIDQERIEAVAGAADQLAKTLDNELESPLSASRLHQVYTDTQKLDYDSDFRIEPQSDGFVDLYDFAAKVSQVYTRPVILDAATRLQAAIQNAVVSERHRSGTPWMMNDRIWPLDGVHGLSIYLPLGEDLHIPMVITSTSPITPGVIVTRTLRLREMYAPSQLAFVKATAWNSLIERYYQVVQPLPVLADKPPSGLLKPDITPPQTHVAAFGKLAAGQAISITWTAVDTQTGVLGASLWIGNPGENWSEVLPQQAGRNGSFLVRPAGCGIAFSIRAVDLADNLEPVGQLQNTILIPAGLCAMLPLILHSSNRP